MPQTTRENPAGSRGSIFTRLIPKRFRRDSPLVTVIQLNGHIGSVTPLRPGLTLSSCAAAIERAFATGGVKAVALTINSPGGSAVQSTLIHNRIRQLADEKKLPVYAFAEDVAASGGYMLALAGDEIHADTSSIVGSIGVISAGFGFVEAIRKLGIERRVHTAGRDKLMLDPFRPQRREDVRHLKALQEDVHEAFKAMVRSRRGDRLKGDEDTLFSGRFWSGEKALELGLIDGIGDLRSVMRRKYGENVRLKAVSAPHGWVRRRLGLATSATGQPDWQGSLWDDALSAIEARLLWSRYGL